jgi:hypothetical protein
VRDRSDLGHRVPPLRRAQASNAAVGHAGQDHTRCRSTDVVVAKEVSQQVDCDPTMGDKRYTVDAARSVIWSRSADTGHFFGMDGTFSLTIRETGDEFGGDWTLDLHLQ